MKIAGFLYNAISKNNHRISKLKNAEVLPANCSSRIRRLLPNEAVPAAKKFVADCALKNKGSNKIYLSFFDEFLSKLERCDDEFVKTQTKQLFSQLSAGRKNSDFFDCTLLLDEMLDVVNCVKGRYMKLFDSINPISVFKPKSDYAYSEPFRLAKIYKNNNTQEIQRKINYETKYSPMKDFLCFHSKQSKLCNYLWENYYLPRFDIHNQKLLREINDELGVKVFSQKNLDKQSLQLIREELRLHKKFSKGSAKLPSVLDINNDAYALSHQKKLDLSPSSGFVDGYTDMCQGKIIIKNPQNVCLRHELIHLNEDWEAIKTVNLSDKEKLELKNAGLSNFDIQYSMEQDESNAVFSQADMSKISKELKKRFVKNNMPLYELELPYFEAVKSNVFLKRQFGGARCAKIIDELEQKLGGQIPKSVRNHLLENRGDFKFVKNILRDLIQEKIVSEEVFMAMLKQKSELTKLIRDKLTAEI